MRRSRQETAQTRAKAVRAAARLFRARGVDGVGLKEIMRAIGMTHGGFYKHFSSKSELVLEAVAAAAEDARQALRNAAEGLPADQRVAAMVGRYLSPAHVAHPENGCPVAALATEASHQSKLTRKAFTRVIEGSLDLLADALSTARDRRSAAACTFAALVGGVVLARATDDRKLADEILAGVRRGVLGKAQVTNRHRR
jgi:TetR/AcrR family transcriptional repressor of nem operon